MLKRVAIMLAALLVTGTSLAYAQTTEHQERPRLSQADLKALTDARIGVVKAALQLTPDQEKYWPALEAAIRARSAGRQQRLAALTERMRQQHDVDPIDVLRERADNMAQRSAELKKLVDAWQPLWQSLSPDQKRRMGFLAVRVLHVMRNAAQVRHMEIEEEDEEHEE